MPRRRSAVKRLRVDKKRRLRNIKIKNQLQKAIKKFRSLILIKNIDEAKSLLKKVYSLLDKAAKKRIIHPNAAKRKKSRLGKGLFKILTSKVT